LIGPVLYSELATWGNGVTKGEFGECSASELTAECCRNSLLQGHRSTISVVSRKSTGRNGFSITPNKGDPP
jgi:hypothetical protein